MGKKFSKVTTSHWGAFNVFVENNKIIKTEPFEADPAPPQISELVPKAVHHSKRIDQPYVRKGWIDKDPDKLRGDDEYIPLPWEDALDLAAKEITRVKTDFGNGAIFGGSYGWASAGRFHHSQSQLHRFLNSIGGYVSSYASYSTGAAQAIIPHVLGLNFHKITWGEINSWSSIAKHTNNLIIFGGINPKNSQVSMGGSTEHDVAEHFKNFKRRQKNMVSISPQQDDSPKETNWLPIIPGTDMALMLAIAYVLETENLADQMFLDTHSAGYQVFKKYFLGTDGHSAKTPEWASLETGIDASQIRDLARNMASGRTLICVSWSLQRARYGEHPFWMACVLAAMLGQIGLPGGGVGFGYGAIGNVGKTARRMQGPLFEQGQNPISDFIPVSRIADMLLNPGGAYNFNGEQRIYPDIKLVYWCGGNPFHHHQDLNRLISAWQHPETVIVHEPWWTATAQRADIVFPATTQFERSDLGWAKGDPYLFFMPQMIQPVGLSRNDYDIFADLSKKLNCEEQFTHNKSSDEWIRDIYDKFHIEANSNGIKVPDFETLKEKNFERMPIDSYDEDYVPFKNFRDDPVKHSLGTPSGKIEIYSEKIAGFNYEEIPGHPIYNKPLLDPKFPLRLLSPQPHDKLHSQLQAAAEDLQKHAVLVMNPQDAKERGVSQGNLVKIWNSRGACLASLQIEETIIPGVVSLATGAWFSPSKDGLDISGNPNVLTADLGTSNLGQGSAAHNIEVQVEKYNEN